MGVKYTVPRIMQNYTPRITELDIHNAGINNLSFQGSKVTITQMLLKLSKQFINNLGLGQLLPKAPNSRSVWNLAAKMQAKEATKGMPVENLILSSIIRKVIQRLQDQDFEKKNDIVAFWARIIDPRLLPNLLYSRPKNLPIDSVVKLTERVAAFVDFMHTMVMVKKSWLKHVILRSQVV